MALEEIKAQLTTRAKEAGFPGYIVFRERMPTYGIYDSGLRPDEEVGTAIRILREELSQYMRGKPVIYIQLIKRSKKQYLATLAHELGHWKLPERPRAITPHEELLREAEAQVQGFVWAKEWGVVPQYMSIEKLLNSQLRVWRLPPIPPLGERLGL